MTPPAAGASVHAAHPAPLDRSVQSFDIDEVVADGHLRNFHAHEILNLDFHFGRVLDDDQADLGALREGIAEMREGKTLDGPEALARLRARL